MGTGKTNTSTQTRVKQPARCNTCGEIPTPACDWRQGRCPHRPSMLGIIMESSYKTRFFNLVKFFKGIK